MRRAIIKTERDNAAGRPTHMVYFDGRRVGYVTRIRFGHWSMRDQFGEFDTATTLSVGLIKFRERLCKAATMLGLET